MFKFGRRCLIAVLAACVLVLGNSWSVFLAAETQPAANQYLIQAGDDLWKIGSRFGIDPQDIAEANGIDLYDPLQVGDGLLIPDSAQNDLAAKGDKGQILDLATAGKLQGSTTSAGYKEFAWPVSGGITSKFGWRKGEFHCGIDIAVSTGTTVRATRPGKVVLAGWNGGFGRAVKIDHGGGYCSIYGHNSKLLVKVDQYVKEGQAIAKSGNTGHSTGPHVHFEVRYNGIAQNPLNFLNNSTQVAENQ